MNNFMCGRYPQKNPDRTDHLWGFDDESIFYDPDPEKNHGVKAKKVQEHPELMHRIMDLCREYFKENNGASS